MTQHQQRKSINGWAAAVWLIFIAHGIGATLVALLWNQQIGLTGILNAWVSPMPWWSGLVLVVLGAAILFSMHRKGTRAW